MRRWTAVLVGTGLLAVVPAALERIPASVPAVTPTELLSLIQQSDRVPYSAVAESRARLGLPDVPRAGRLVALFGETTRMRAWVASPERWRVDALSPIGEHDTYRDPAGTWVWDSEERTATRINGEQEVRFARPADLLPSELGRRLAAGAAVEEVAPLEPRRVAGVAAVGLSIAPRSAATTVGEVALWADPRSGLPVRVEVTGRGLAEPVLTSTFLDLEQSPPPPGTVRFAPPPDATVDVTVAPDFAAAVARYSPFVLPAELAGAPLRDRVAGAASTYGRGFDVVAALALPERFSPAEELTALPVVSGPWGVARLAETPLFNGMAFERGGVAYFLAGSVLPRVLKRRAAALARAGVGVGG